MGKKIKKILEWIIDILPLGFKIFNMIEDFIKSKKEGE